MINDNCQNRNLSTIKVKQIVSQPEKGKTNPKLNLNPKQTYALPKPKIMSRPMLSPRTILSSNPSFILSFHTYISILYFDQIIK